MTCDCLYRLEKALLDHNPHDLIESRLLNVVRDAQRKAVPPSAYATGSQPWDYQPITNSELAVLRAWDKWAREVAVPALEQHANSHPVNCHSCGFALGKRPKDAT